MKITYCLLAVLLIGTCANAMELAPLLPAQKIYTISTYQDIPFIPFQNIYNSFFALPVKKQKKIERTLSKSLLFNIVILPQELQALIIGKMTEGNKFAAEKFIKQPVLMSFQIYDEIKKHAAYSDGVVKISKGDISIHTLFALKQEERNKVLGICATVKTNSVISRDDYDALNAIVPQELKEAQFLLKPDCRRHCLLFDKFSADRILPVIGFMFFNGLIGGAGRLLQEHGYHVTSGIFVATGIIIDVGLLGYGIYKYRNYALTNAEPIINSDTEDETRIQVFDDESE